MVQSFQNLEFVLVNIVSSREQRGKFAYELPGHVTEVHEVYLQDADWGRKRWRQTSRLKLRPGTAGPAQPDAGAAGGMGRPVRPVWGEAFFD